MKVGASYYPELIPRPEWERDLATGREIGLSCLRCGEFAWSAFAPTEGAWTPEWALDFLELAENYGYEVLWCTPSAAPPPYLFARWPDLYAVNIDGVVMPIGIRRQYCPSHQGYRELCAKVAAQLAKALGSSTPLRGWQVDNELAADGFTCWCERCRRSFHVWLQNRYGTLSELNAMWQTGVWSQVYTAWDQIPVPARPFGAHAPAIQIDYRRFQSDTWLDFYRWQYESLHNIGARRVTTNFYGVDRYMPFDRWQWRPHLDAIGSSHYVQDETSSRFQIALLQGPLPGEKPLWILEQRAGQQSAQNLYPEDLKRVESHLRICAEAGAEYSVYWHLRQHSAGCEMENGAVLRHDGKPTRIAHAIQDAIQATASVAPRVPGDENLLVFSFQQDWANETRPQLGTRWSYLQELDCNWYGAALEVLGDIRIGSVYHITEQRLILAPFLQLVEPRMWEQLRNCLDSGSTVITTVDLARLDYQNNVLRQAPLGGLSRWLDVPDMEVLHLKPEVTLVGRMGRLSAAGKVFWAVPEPAVTAERLGTLSLGTETGPFALRFPIGAGSLIVALTAPDRSGVAALIKHAMSTKR